VLLSQENQRQIHCTARRIAQSTVIRIRRRLPLSSSARPTAGDNLGSRYNTSNILLALKLNDNDNISHSALLFSPWLGLQCLKRCLVKIVNQDSTVQNSCWIMLASFGLVMNGVHYSHGPRRKIQRMTNWTLQKDFLSKMPFSSPWWWQSMCESWGTRLWYSSIPESRSMEPMTCSCHNSCSKPGA